MEGCVHPEQEARTQGGARAQHVLRLIAQRGGFLAHKGDCEPGGQVDLAGHAGQSRLCRRSTVCAPERLDLACVYTKWVERRCGCVEPSEFGQQRY